MKLSQTTGLCNWKSSTGIGYGGLAVIESNVEQHRGGLKKNGLCSRSLDFRGRSEAAPSWLPQVSHGICKGEPQSFSLALATGVWQQGHNEKDRNPGGRREIKQLPRWGSCQSVGIAAEQTAVSVLQQQQLLRKLFFGSKRSTMSNNNFTWSMRTMSYRRLTTRVLKNLRLLQSTTCSTGACQSCSLTTCARGLIGKREFGETPFPTSSVGGEFQHVNAAGEIEQIENM